MIIRKELDFELFWEHVGTVEVVKSDGWSAKWDGVIGYGESKTGALIDLGIRISGRGGVPNLLREVL